MTVDVGTDRELTVDAPVYVRSRGYSVATGIVLSVDDDHAFVRISDGLANVVVGSTVVFEVPEACTSRRR